jgi:hypothetical protein
MFAKAKAVWWSTATSGQLATTILLQLQGETFGIWLYQHAPPPPLKATLAPSHHLDFGRRPEKVHCMEILHTLYVVFLET